jgi:hypothetical protein
VVESLNANRRAEVSLAPADFSGAELEQVVISALLRALQEQRPLDAELLVAEVGPRCPYRCRGARTSSVYAQRPPSASCRFASLVATLTRDAQPSTSSAA